MIQGFIRRFGDVLYDVSVGLLKQYKRTTVDLAKIELASYYVRAIKIIRKECMISTLVILGVIIFANMLGVIQFAILLYAPWSIPARVAAALGFGIVCAVIPLVIVLQLFSERRWMAVTKADEFVAKAMSGATSVPADGVE